MKNEVEKINNQQGNVVLPCVTTRFTFDCWYFDNGTPLKRYVDAENVDKAIELFEKTYPDMRYDYPYE